MHLVETLNDYKRDKNITELEKDFLYEKRRYYVNCR